MEDKIQNKVNIIIHTEIETIEWSIGNKILNAFLDFDEKLISQSLWSWNKKIGDFSDVSECEKHWAPLAVSKGVGDNYSYREFHTGLSWKRRKSVKYSAQMYHTFINRNNRLIRGYLTFSSNYLEGIDWSKLFDRLTDILQSDRAFLQVHNDIETRMFELTDFDRLSNLANVSIIPIDVKSVRTPIKHIDENIAEKIKNNGFFIEKLPNAYKIKVCKNIHDFVNDFEGFCRKRAHLKSLFPEGSFKVKEEPISIS